MQEVETGGGVAAAAADPLSAWALERFWRPAGAHTQRRSPQPLPPGLATPSAAAGTASRYQSDFQASFASYFTIIIGRYPCSHICTCPAGPQYLVLSRNLQDHAIMASLASGNLR